MPLLVMKFGGTSVADLARIENAAKKVQKEVDRGYDVIVIVSAMSGETNRLVGYVEGTSKLYDAREYDAVVAAGENVTAGLMALRLQEMGIPARSWQGWQVPINTTAQHGSARFVSIPRDNIDAKFAEGFKVAVVAGFQGLSPEGRVTTLGRGGSDTTAVAFAAAFGATGFTAGFATGLGAGLAALGASFGAAFCHFISAPKHQFSQQNFPRDRSYFYAFSYDHPSYFFSSYYFHGERSLQ